MDPVTAAVTIAVAAVVQEILGWLLATGIAIGFATVVFTTLRQSQRGDDDQRNGRTPPAARRDLDRDGQSHRTRW